MKKIIGIIVLFGVITLGCNESQSENDNSTANDTTVVAEVLDLETMFADADAYIDDTVAVKGIVDHICEHGGKKIFLVQDENSIKIFGEDRFDEELVGQDIIVNAVLKEKRVDSTYLAEWEAEVDANHEEGDQEAVAARKKIEHMRDSISGTEKGYVSHYSMDFVSFKK